MCACGLIDFSRISLLAHRALVVDVLIAHVTVNPACITPAREYIQGVLTLRPLSTQIYIYLA